MSRNPYRELLPADNRFVKARVFDLGLPLEERRRRYAQVIQDEQGDGHIHPGQGWHRHPGPRYHSHAEAWDLRDAERQRGEPEHGL